MNILFFGSHQYSLYPLEALFKAGHKILGVVTQPDRPVGRHQELTQTPVKIWALIHQIPVFSPKNSQELSRLLLFDPDLVGRELTGETSRPPKAGSKNEIDVGVVSVYGLIIPKEVLSLPKYGFLNIHPSLLPKYRGASPVQAAIISGDKETGVTIFKMDEKLDHGSIICQEKEKIKEEDTAETLYPRLFQKGANLLIKTLSLPPTFALQCQATAGKQDDAKASYARMLKRNDGFIPWEYVSAAMEGKDLNQKIQIEFIRNNQNRPFYILHSTFYIHNIIRGLSPWPGAWTEVTIQDRKAKPILDRKAKKKRLKLLKSHVENKRLVLDLVQLEGEKPRKFPKQDLL